MGKETTEGSNFRIAFWINLVFSAIEFAGGLFFGSLAILSDALHDFSDSISIGIGWYFQKLSNKSRNRNYSYGFRRFSVLGAVINAVILLVGGSVVIYHAILNIIEPGNPDAIGMVGMAIIGIIFNYIAYRRMHGGKSLNEQVVSLHLLEDVLGWVAVLVGGGVMYFTGIAIIDPILSLLISLFISYKAIRRLGHCLHLMLQGVPDNLDLEAVSNTVRNHKKVQEIHDLHAWSMDGEYSVLTLHITLNKEFDMNQQDILKSEIRESLKTYPINHVTIDLDKEGNKGSDLLNH